MKAIFLDRDGTLVKDYPNEGWRKIEHLDLYPDTVEALRKLVEKFTLFIISNQYLIGEGIITQEQFDRLNQEFLQKLSSSGIKIEKTYYCPHARSLNCECCKPKPGLVKQCLKEYDIDLAGSYLIGNTKTDAETARAVNVKPIIIRSESKIENTIQAKNLEEAVNKIMEKEG